MNGLLWRFVIVNFLMLSYSNTYFLLPSYLDKMGIVDIKLISWVMGIYFGASTIGRPFTAQFIEICGLRRVLKASTLICFCSAIGIALAGSSVALILCFRAVSGIAFGMLLVAISTAQMIAVPDDKRGGSFALTSAGSMASMLVFTPIADFFLHKGFNSIYPWIPPFLALASYFVKIDLPEEQENAPGKSKGMKGWAALLRMPDVRALLISVAFLGVSDAFILFIASISMIKGLIPSSFLSAYAFAAIGVRLLCFRAMDRLPRKAIAAPSFGIMALAILTATFSSNNWHFAICGVAYGLSMGFGYPVHVSLVGDVVPLYLRARLSSLFWFLYSLIFFLFPIFVGHISSSAGVIASLRVFSLSIFAASFFVAKWVWHERWGQLKKRS